MICKHSRLVNNKISLEQPEVRCKQGHTFPVEVIQIVITTIAGILVPVTPLVIRNWYTRQKERAETNQRNADRNAILLSYLASDKTSEHLLALQVLRYLDLNNEFPPELTNTVTAITFRDNPDVAGAALLVMSDSDMIPDEVVLLELLAPLKVQFDRTREAFKTWMVRDEVTEQVIKHSNEYIRDLLVTRAYLVPEDLQKDAGELVKHYNAWLAEYQRVYKDGVRDPSVAYVFVGDKGFAFPKDSEQRFLERYRVMRDKRVSKPRQ
jgi:hypothetical protein